MASALDHSGYLVFPLYLYVAKEKAIAPFVSCDWAALKAQLLLQWKKLTMKELEKTGRDRHKIAMLVANKYGIHYRLIENYLRNFERTMPKAAA